MAEKRIVRIMTTDIDGSLNVERGLRKIKGVGFVFSKSTCTVTGVNPKKRLGELTTEEVKKLEEFIKKPGLPRWMLNRRKDPETGDDIHLSMAGLALKKREDINLLRKVRAYRGIRHEQGLPTRGQRTRGSFRTSKAVGVSKKKVQQPAKKEGK